MSASVLLQVVSFSSKSLHFLLPATFVWSPLYGHLADTRLADHTERSTSCLSERSRQESSNRQSSMLPRTSKGEVENCNISVVGVESRKIRVRRYIHRAEHAKQSLCKPHASYTRSDTMQSRVRLNESKSSVEGSATLRFACCYPPYRLPRITPARQRKADTVCNTRDKTSCRYYIHENYHINVELARSQLDNCIWIRCDSRSPIPMPTPSTPSCADYEPRSLQTCG